MRGIRCIALGLFLCLPWVTAQATDEPIDLDEAGRALASEDFVRAERLFGQAARAGHPAAQFFLALIYAIGLTGEVDDAEASAWFLQAARGGDARAQFHIAKRYETGKGIEKDLKQSFHWYRQSAEAGNAQGQANLGFMHLHGIGTPVDYEQAVYWLREGLRGRAVSAPFNLSQMHYHGLGVPEDRMLALMWMTVAKGMRGEEEQHATIEEARADIAKKLQRHEIDLAEQLARACLLSSFEKCGSTE